MNLAIVGPPARIDALRDAYLGAVAIGWVVGGYLLVAFFGFTQRHVHGWDGLLRRFGMAAPEREQAPGAPVPDAESTSAEATAPSAGPSADDVPSWLEGRTEADEAEVAALAIPDYDNLSASQVVPRLDGLTPDELEAVRRYERKHRHRKTILNRIGQLQAGPA